MDRWHDEGRVNKALGGNVETLGAGRLKDSGTTDFFAQPGGVMAAAEYVAAGVQMNAVKKGDFTQAAKEDGL